MLIAAAICPHPPLLVPEAACGAAAELDELRAACDTAVAVVAAADPDLIAVVGGAAQAAEFGSGAAGSLAGYGVGWRTGTGEAVLPLSLTIGRWLLERAGLLSADPAAAATGPGPAQVRLHAVAFAAPTAECLRRGAQIAAQARRAALLVMGDGPACLSPQAPGYFDARAGPYDTGVAAALAAADAGRLARLDPGVSADLLAAGRAAWQVLAGAAGPGRFRGRLRYAAAPYGVSYLAASWTSVHGIAG